MHSVSNPYLVDTSALQTEGWDWRDWNWNWFRKPQKVLPETPQDTAKREISALKFLQEQNQVAQFACRLILWGLNSMNSKKAESLQKVESLTLTTYKQNLLAGHADALLRIDANNKHSENIVNLTEVVQDRDKMLEATYVSQQKLVYELEHIVSETYNIADRDVAIFFGWYWNLACYGSQVDHKEASDRVGAELNKSEKLYGEYDESLHNSYRQSDDTYWQRRLKRERKHMISFLCTVVLQAVVPTLKKKKNKRIASVFERIAADCEKDGVSGTATLDQLQRALGRVWFLLHQAETLMLYEGKMLSFIFSAYKLEVMQPTLEENEWAEIGRMYYTKIAEIANAEDEEHKLTHAEAATRGQ